MSIEYLKDLMYLAKDNGLGLALRRDLAVTRARHPTLNAAIEKLNSRQVKDITRIAKFQGVGSALEHALDMVSLGKPKLSKVTKYVKQAIPLKGVSRGESLRGKPFIGLRVVYDNPKDGAFGDWMYRDCGSCLMREDVRGRPTEDCGIMDKPAHEFFGVDKSEILPKEMDGKKTGNFCPYFVDFRAE